MSYETLLESNKKWIDETWKKLDDKLSRVAVKSRNKLPYTTINGEHDNRAHTPLMWTNGFWGGLMWQMYVGTGKECYKITAETSEKLMDAAFDHMEGLYHDVGFMWHLTSGVNYRLTGNKDSKNRNLLAAMSLMSRYNVDGNFIRCWNGKWLDEDVEGWSIVDCMMNVPILYWASKEIGDARFTKVAMRHADMTMRDHVREDGSVNHIVIHDTQKDRVLGVRKGQGYAENSCWSRGASWALYGFTLSYIHTQAERYLDTAKKVAEYFITETQKTNWLPRLDFRQPQTPLYYDSTAGAIASCGLIELAKIVQDETEKEKYLSAALHILKTMEEKWCNWEENEDSILQMGSLMYDKEQHMPIIYGDYFFAEAILKLKGTDFLAW